MRPCCDMGEMQNLVKRSESIYLFIAIVVSVALLFCVFGCASDTSGGVDGKSNRDGFSSQSVAEISRLEEFGISKPFGCVWSSTGWKNACNKAVWRELILKTYNDGF